MNIKALVLAAIAVSLSACGGGGGNSQASTVVVQSSSSLVSSSTVSSVAPAPSIAITLDKEKVGVGETGIVSITTANADSCSEATLGIIPVNGSVNLSPTRGGRVTYTITCNGEGGSASKDFLVITPFPVYKTSYENKMNVQLESYVLPVNGPWAIGNILGPVDEEWRSSPSINGQKSINPFSVRSIAFADFLQNGTMVAIVSTTEFKNIYPEFNQNNYPDSPGKLYFVQQDPITKKWTDISLQLFKNNERASVISPGFFQIADLNNDDKPDVYVAGWGADFPLANNDWSATKSDSYVVLSQDDGSYKTIPLPFPKFFAHQSALADLDGDGNIDILTTNTDFSAPKSYKQKPMVMWGNGDGTFSVPDQNVFPDDTVDKGIFGLTAIPINGVINVVVSGGNPNSAVNQWAPGIYGTKVLQYSNGKLEVVADLTGSLPLIPNTSYSFEFVINAAFYKNHWVFLLIDTATGGYKGAIATLDKDGKNSSIIHMIDPLDWTFSAEFKIDFDSDVLLPMAATCSRNPAASFSYCDLKLKL